MKSIKKYIYITVGFIAFALGGLGVILPILPTTPFLLLASYCFAKGSDRFNNCFIETKLYKNHLDSFVKERAMTLKEKICIVGFADIMLMFPLIILDSLFMKFVILTLMLIKFYYFIFKIKTITKEEKIRLKANS